MNHLRRIVTSVVCMGFFAACGGGSNVITGSNCPTTTPFVQQLYPIPGAKRVDTNVGVLILAGSKQELPWLQKAEKFLFYGKQVPLPSPLPQPELTPAPGASRYAASIRALAPQTQYDVWANLVVVTCDSGFDNPQKLGSFRTK